MLVSLMDQHADRVAIDGYYLVKMTAALSLSYLSVNYALSIMPGRH